MSQGGFSPLDYPTILQLYSVFGAFPIFSALALATVYLVLLAQHLVNDHAATSPRLGGVGHEFHSFTVFESMSKGRTQVEEQRRATHLGPLLLDDSAWPPIISDPNMNWWAALRICDCFEAGVCSFRFMMKQYQAPDVLIRSIQFSKFHCDHESKVYFGPAKNAAIHLRLGLNFDPYPMWGCPKNEAHPMQMGSSWFIITFQTKSPNWDKLDEPIRYIVLLWYNLWL